MRFIQACQKVHKHWSSKIFKNYAFTLWSSNSPWIMVVKDFYKLCFHIMVVKRVVVKRMQNKIFLKFVNFSNAWLMWFSIMISLYIPLKHICQKSCVGKTAFFTIGSFKFCATKCKTQWSIKKSHFKLWWFFL